MTEDDKLDLLKTILLTDDRVYAETIASKIDVLEETLRERQKLSERVSPIIKDEINEFSLSIPEKLGPVITETLRIQIVEAKDQVVEALFPILGLMVKKYVASEIKILSERIDQMTKDAFSINGLSRRFSSIFTGTNHPDVILSRAAQAQVEQVFIIEKGSGILLASYGIKQTIDEDMLSGMLTAIKAFVEDAFMQSGRNLKSIAYDLYELHLQDFPSYYIVTAISGTFTEVLENNLEIINFKVSGQINKYSLLQNIPELEVLLAKAYYNILEIKLA